MFKYRMFKKSILFVALLLIITLIVGCTQIQSVKTQPDSPGSQNSKDNKWFVLRGDLHCHSSFSVDSNAPIETVVSDSVKAGYDFISLTEHNTQEHLKYLKEEYSNDDLIIIPGYEWTLKRVHMNMFGLYEFEEKLGLDTFEEINSYIDYIHELGSIVQINHPNWKALYAQFALSIPGDLMEVWNGPFGTDDKKTLKDWQNLLTEGKKIIATAGRDEHENYLNNSPVNNVYAEEKTAENIFENIKKGHLYITAMKDCSDIWLSCGDAIMGDTVEYAKGSQIYLKIEKLPHNAKIKIYSNKGIEFEEIYDASKNTAYEKEFLVEEDKSFYRVEVWSAAVSIPLGISNPIYIENNNQNE